VGRLSVHAFSRDGTRRPRPEQRLCAVLTGTLRGELLRHSRRTWQAQGRLRTALWQKSASSVDRLCAKRGSHGPHRSIRVVSLRTYRDLKIWASSRGNSLTVQLSLGLC
jgi:hypothetical protein